MTLNPENFIMIFIHILFVNNKTIKRHERSTLRGHLQIMVKLTTLLIQVFTAKKHSSFHCLSTILEFKHFVDTSIYCKENYLFLPQLAYHLGFQASLI